MMNIGGIDIGTTGCKLTVYDDSGKFIANSYVEYEINRANGEHEIDAEVIFNSVCKLFMNISSECKLDAVGITTFGETFVALDSDDKPVMPSMLYTDPRGEKECDDLCKALGEEKIISIAGVKPHHMYSLPKIMWIKNNRPDLFAKIKHIFLIEDYIIYILTGNAVIDYSLAARTMAFDIRNKCWSDEIFDAAGIDKNLMSKPVPAFNKAGKIKKELAQKLGTDADITIVNGTHDQVAAVVGSGILNPGKAVDGTGTVECITPVFDKIPQDKEMYDKGYCVVPFVYDDMYVCYAFSFTGGAAVKWYRDNFAKNVSYKELDAQAGDKPTGILVMPHFAGAATPYMDSASKAVIMGLTLEHTAADLYKAVMEGVTYEIMLNLEQLEKNGIIPEKLYATGGGASSDVWLQIKADILNRPITSLSAKEAGTCGTCMMTGVAMGLYPDLQTAKKYFVKEAGTFIPNKEKTDIYRKYYNAYKKIYNASRPIIEEGHYE